VNLFIIFMTGLTTGGLSCIAMQGGLLASVIANQKEQELADIESDENLPQLKISRQERRRQKYLDTLKKNKFTLKSFDQLDWLPVAMFLGAKLISHTILGFLLGALGSVMTLSLGARLGFQIFTAAFMFGTAMNLMDVHPIFRHLAIKPPKFLQKMIRNTSKSQALYAPAILGLMTVFIPCGVTQAMEVLAINGGNPIYGAMIMFAFVLGTSPLFAVLGVATAKMSEGWHQKFTKIAAYSLVAMAIYSVNGVLLVVDFPITLNRIVRPVTWFFSDERFAEASLATVANGVQQVAIGVENRGYNPSYVQVQSGVPVELTLTSNGTYSCALAFVFREFGISTFLDATDQKTFTFTPTKPGKYTYSCSMGMYSGVMEVI
jgi:uncharacterized protein